MPAIGPKELALRAQREAKVVVVTRMFGVTKPKKRAKNIVTRNTPEKGGNRRTGKEKAPNLPPALGSKKDAAVERAILRTVVTNMERLAVGRPKVHATAAARQAAYRARLKEAKA